MSLFNIHSCINCIKSVLIVYYFSSTWRNIQYILFLSSGTTYLRFHVVYTCRYFCLLFVTWYTLIFYILSAWTSVVTHFKIDREILSYERYVRASQRVYWGRSIVPKKVNDIVPGKRQQSTLWIFFSLSLTHIGWRVHLVSKWDICLRKLWKTASRRIHNMCAKESYDWNTF